MRNEIKLMDLPYEKSALEPVITKETLEFHHGKHLATYVANLNGALEKEASLQDKSLEDILTNLASLDSANVTAIRNNGGGVYNHNFYFEALCTQNSTKVGEKTKELIEKSFGSFDNFASEFKNAGLTQFGSGWAWLVVDKNNEAKIIKTANQDTPLELGLKPLLTVDVWEHAYYIDYQNRRADYLENFLSIVNWEVVENRLK